MWAGKPVAGRGRASLARSPGDVAGKPPLFAHNQRGRPGPAGLFPSGLGSILRPCPRLWSVSDLASNEKHQHASNHAKRRHEVEVVSKAPVEQVAQKVAGQTATEVLEGVDQAQGKPCHATPANVHGSG